MYIDGPAVPVPAEFISAAAQTGADPRPDICDIMEADPAVVRKAAPAAPRRLEGQEMRVIPCAKGVLLTAELPVTGFNLIPKKAPAPPRATARPAHAQSLVV